jgi:hypothetical protein
MIPIFNSSMTTNPQKRTTDLFLTKNSPEVPRETALDIVGGVVGLQITQRIPIKNKI